MVEFQPQPRSIPAIRSNTPLNWLVAAVVAIAISATLVDSIVDADLQARAEPASAAARS